VLAAPGTAYSVEVLVPDHFTDPNPGNNIAHFALGHDTDMSVSLTDSGRTPFRPGTRGRAGYKVTVANHGRASVGSFRIRVRTEDDNATIQIRVTRNTDTGASVCPGAESCTLTYRFTEHAFQLGGTQDLWVFVVAEQGSGITIEVSPRGGYVDTDAANDTGSGDIPVG
jgi:hypothetical protein